MHRLSLRVYYEDTDLAGIVYYANYFRFIERGRTEWLRSAGIDQLAMKEETGVVFAVRRLQAEFLKPARMDDVLVVETRIVEMRWARIVMDQRVLRDENALFAASVTLACLGKNGRAARVPGQVISAVSR